MSAPQRPEVPIEFEAAVRAQLDSAYFRYLVRQVRSEEALERMLADIPDPALRDAVRAVIVPLLPFTPRES